MDLDGNLNVVVMDYGNMYRLPDNVLPLKYKLTLDPDLEGGTFTGDIVIEVDVKESTRRIFLNSHKLVFKSVRVQVDPPKGLTVFPVECVQIQPQRQLLIITMEAHLVPGCYSIIMSYTGVMNTESLGLYRTWIGTGESQKFCMATYFEPTYARFAYPCFDEPHFKAKYSISLVSPSVEGYVALSNSASELEIADYPRVGASTTHFIETPPISSYLTCFVVGVFDRLQPIHALSGRVAVSIYSQPDLVEHTAVARDLAPTVLDFFSKYFQIDYPLSKLDLIAIPDSKLGGMENWGLITFRESALLTTNEASSVDLLTISTVIIHELSHMWFGNLVTIAWWNDTWLKEGMADFMSYVGGNHVYPSWYQEWVFLSGQVFPALKKDSALSTHPVVQNVAHPDQIRQMFDIISYLKGACLIRMIHDIDNMKFRHGLNTYLQRMKWSDAETQDLWLCLSECMDWCVGDLMGPWTEQSGYPVVTVNRQSNDFVLSQVRFLTSAPSTFDTSTSPYKYVWDIPIKYITSEDKKKVEFTWFHRSAPSAVIPCSEDTKWIKLNWHNVGFYRVNYSDSMWMEFAQLLQNDLTALDGEDRCSLINDAWCLAKEGYVKYDIPLSLIRYLSSGKEDYFLVWSVVKDHLDSLQSLLSSSNSSLLFSKYVEKLIGPVVSNLNWDIGENVPYMERKLRVELIELACLLGFESVLDRIRSMFSDWIEKKKSKPSPELKLVVHSYGLCGNQNEELWEKTWQQYITEQNPSDILHYLRSLASTTDPNFIIRLFKEAKNPDVVRSQDFFILLRLISKSAIGNCMVWSFLVSEWEYLVERFSINDLQLGRTVSFVAARFSNPQQLELVEEFFAKYPEAGAGATERKHTIETIQANIRWKNDNNEFLDNWFSKA